MVIFKRLVSFMFLLFFTTLCFSQDVLAADDKREIVIEDIGDVLQIVLPATAGLSTLFLKDKEGFWQFLKSYVGTITLTYILKYTFNKPRPESAADGHAFPSGHTASAFSGASFIQRRYGWKYGASAYALAGFVAYSRLEGENDRHDVWDALGGMVVGIGNTYIFTTPYQRDHYEFTFQSGREAYLLGLKYKF